MVAEDRGAQATLRGQGVAMGGQLRDGSQEGRPVWPLSQGRSARGGLWDAGLGAALFPP